MKVIAEKPPIYDRIARVFGDLWDQGVVITYGDDCYTKSGGISPDLHAHEEVHVRQQRAMGKDEWWNRYFVDTKFRLEQELEAYKVQAAYIRQWVGNRRKRDMKLDQICRDMAEMYNGMITYQEARAIICP